LKLLVKVLPSPEIDITLENEGLPASLPLIVTFDGSVTVTAIVSA
jgi:hypothetical protein